MFSFNAFAFTAQVTHKINSIQIIGLILICLHFTTVHFHTCTLHRMQPIYLFNSWLSFQRLGCVLWGFTLSCFQCLCTRRTYVLVTHYTSTPVTCIIEVQAEHCTGVLLCLLCLDCTSCCIGRAFEGSHTALYQHISCAKGYIGLFIRYRIRYTLLWRYAVTSSP